MHSVDPTSDESVRVGRVRPDLPNGTPLQTDRQAKGGAVVFACAAMPAWVFNAKTLQAALQRFRFFPTPGDVLELVSSRTRATRVRLWTLRKLAEVGPDEPPRAG